MDIYCLKTGISQSDAERNANLEMLRKLITPESGIEGGAAAEETAEQRPQLQSAIDVVTDGDQNFRHGGRSDDRIRSGCRSRRQRDGRSVQP